MDAGPRSGALFGMLLSAGAVAGASGFLLRGLGLFSTLVLLNSISVYEYGLWRLALGAVGIFGLLALPGFDSLITADLGREAGKENRSLYKAVFLKMSGLLAILSLAACVLLLMIAPFITRVSGIDMTLLLRVLAFTIFTTTLQRVYAYAFSTNLRFAHAQGVALVNASLYLAALTFFSWEGKLSVLHVAMSMLISSVMTILIFLPPLLTLLRSIWRMKDDSEYSLMRTLREHGKWGIVSGYTDTASSSLKPWIMGFFVGIEAVGLFSAAIAIFSALNNLLPLNQVLASVLPRSLSDRARLVFLLKRSLKYTFFAYVVLGLIAFTAVPLLIPVLFPSYTASIPLFLLACASLLSIPLSNQQTQILNMFRSQKFLVVAHTGARFISVALILPISLVLCGVYGAVIDQIATSALVLLAKNRYVHRLLPELSYPMSELCILDSYDRGLVAKIFARIRSLV